MNRNSRTGFATSLHSFSRNEEIYGEGEGAHYWYKVVSGTVRACNTLADGRRYIAEFYFLDDFFGFGVEDKYLTSAEALCDVILVRYPYAALGQLSGIDPHLAQRLHALAAKNSIHNSARMVLLARMTARERFASFLLDEADRANSGRRVQLMMTRHDIADHLGLTYETVCRVISSMKREGTIKQLADAHQIEFLDYPRLDALRAGKRLCREPEESGMRLRASA